MISEISIEPLKNVKLNPILAHLPMHGIIKIINDCFAYLDIDDDFIHKIFPLLINYHIKKPEYFSKEKNFIGAHISLIYPEEQIHIINYEKKVLPFEVCGLFKAYLPETTYYILKVQSQDLLKFRHRHGLSDKLLFKGNLIDLHITVAVEE